MKEEEKSKRPARRKAESKVGRKPTHGQGRGVSFDDSSYQTLSIAAHKFGHSKGAYAGAAIRYFAELGLDPTKQTAGAGMAEVLEKLGELTVKVDGMQEVARKQSADIGNRVVGMWRTLEKNLYAHLSTEQSSLILYLESIETNLLARATGTEAQYLWPLMERMFRVVAELNVARQITSDVYELRTDPTLPDSKLNEANSYHERQIQKTIMELSQRAMESVKLTEQKKTKRPDLTTAPGSALPPMKVPVPPAVPPAKP